MLTKYPTKEEIEKQQDEAYKQGGKAYWGAAIKTLQRANVMLDELQNQNQHVIPDWFRRMEIPIVFWGSYHTPHLFISCAVKFHTIVWDRNYGQGAPEKGWKPVDRPPLIVDVRIPIYLATTDPKTGIVFQGHNVMASRTMPHSHKGGAECFVGLSGENYLKTYQDYEILRGRIANYLGGANLASLASHWGDWDEELRACFPQKLAEVIAAESLKNTDPNPIWGARAVAPDYTQEELADLTWGGYDDNP